MNFAAKRPFCATEATLQTDARALPDPAPSRRETGADDHRCVKSSRLLGGALLLAAWTILWNKLRIDWTVSDQYRYGWFVPPLALALFCLRWRDRPAPQPLTNRQTKRWATLAAFCLLGLLPLRLVEEPNGDWRLLFWLHGVALVALTLAAAAWMGGGVWARHFAFPACFLLLGLPWPSGPEQAIVQGLMRGVASIAAEGMNLLGIPASQQGNLIRVRDQLVGVNEACSGIRSLQTVLMAALLLGELSRLSAPRRWALLLGGWTAAMAANVFRSGLLVWIAANQGADALARCHDAAGVAVLVIVFVGLLWINGCLERGNPALERKTPLDAPMPLPIGAERFVSRGALIAAALWLIGVEAGVAGWYGWHERNRAPLPRWSVTLPAAAPGFKPAPVDDVTRSLLRFDESQSARWRRASPPEADCTLFFFRWEPGRASATLAAMHQPRACLPAGGMTQIAEHPAHAVTTASELPLPVEEYEFLYRQRHVYVYYIVWQDRPNGEETPDEPGTRWDRLRPVLRGQRNLGRQTLEMALVGPSDADEARAAFARELNAVVRRQD